jgi:hypothetical protein
MDKIAKEFNYDDYYIGTITQQYYHNPLGVISNHNCGERLFELIKEEAEEIYK